MILFSTLQYCLRGNLIYSFISRQDISDTDRLLLADISSEPAQNCMYVSDGETAKEFISLNRNFSKLNLIVSSSSWNRDEELPSEINLIVSDLPMPALFNRISKILITEQNPRFLRSENDSMTRERTSLALIMEDIFLAKNSDLDYLRSRLNQAPEKLKSFVTSVICSFDEDKVSKVRFLGEIQKIFKTRNITIYDGKVVAWLSGDTHVFRPDFDRKALNDVLKKYDSWCIISNSARFIMGIKTLYLQSNEMLSMLPHMGFVLNDSRFTFFEDVTFYYIITVYSQTLKEKFGHDKLVYLAGPNIMEIIRYDKDHGTDLQDFIYTYTDCGGSISETAERMHLHRNSITARINKIEALLGINIKDPRIFEELHNSAMILAYSKYILRQQYRIALTDSEK